MPKTSKTKSVKKRTKIKKLPKKEVELSTTDMKKVTGGFYEPWPFTSPPPGVKDGGPIKSGGGAK